MFHKKQTDDTVALCDVNALVEDLEGNTMPVFKGDEVYSRSFELQLKDMAEEGFLLMPATFEREYQKNKKKVLIEGHFQITV